MLLGDFNSNLVHLMKFLTVIKEAELMMNIAKCKFAQL